MSNHQTVPTGPPGTTARRAAACLPAAHFHGVGVQPHSWQPRLVPACPTRPRATGGAQSRRLAAELQIAGAIAAGNAAKDAQRRAGLT